MAPSPSIHDTAAHALEVIPSARYWAKRQFDGGNGGERHCLVSALRQNLEGGWGKNRRHLDRVYHAAAEIINEQFPGCYQLGYHPYLPTFNDARRTRYADVRLVLEKLAARED